MKIEVLAKTETNLSRYVCASIIFYLSKYWTEEATMKQFLDWHLLKMCQVKEMKKKISSHRKFLRFISTSCTLRSDVFMHKFLKFLENIFKHFFKEKFLW